jgi:hypothetical protein
MFAAITPLSLWMAVGLWQLGRRLPQVRWRLVPVAVSVAWFVGAALASLLVLGGAYRSSHPVDSAHVVGTHAITFREPGAGGPSILMGNATREPLAARVGEYLIFDTLFQLYERFSRDWSVFIHLENDDGLIVAQRDVYLGQGMWATSLLHPERTGAWENLFAVRIPDYAYAPQSLKVYLGFYDLKTGERMVATGEGVKDNRAYVASVELLPRDSPLKVPNPWPPTSAGGPELLAGYDVSRLVAEPGGTFQCDVHWRALRAHEHGLSLFTQVQPNDQPLRAAMGCPPPGAAPTSTWKPGEIIEDKHTPQPSTRTRRRKRHSLSLGSTGSTKGAQGQHFRRLRVVRHRTGGEAEDMLSLTRDQAQRRLGIEERHWEGSILWPSPRPFIADGRICIKLNTCDI